MDDVVEPIAEPVVSPTPMSAPEPEPELPLRLMPDPIMCEPFWKRQAFLILALGVAFCYAFFLGSYWSPAPGRPGIDENAYLVAGKNIAQHGTLGFKPASDFMFVGAMWVRTDSGWYYPKYPAGLPLLNAIAIWVGGEAHHREWAFCISPISMVLSALGIFLLTRALVGSFEAILAMIVLATIPTSLEMAEIPGSHAPALCAVVWGMFLLIRWWQTGSIWRGVLAGLALGFAVTIRYSEALLLFPLYPLRQIFSDTSLATSHPFWWGVLGVVRFLPLGPLGLAAMLSARWRLPKTWWRSAIPIAAWGIPVGVNLAFNYVTMGHLTGYDTTNESVGFTSKEFLNKWDFTIHELYLYGMFLFLPLGLVGLVMMYRGSWRAALLLGMWFLPGTLLYTAYYWGKQAPGVAFLRFFLTLFPPLIVAAMWLLRRAADARIGESPRTIAMPLGAGALTVATALVGLTVSIPVVERQYRANMNLHFSAIQLKAAMGKDARKPAVLFSDDQLFPMHLSYFQFMTDFDCYESDSFEPRMGGGFGFFGAMQKDKGTEDAPKPVLIQPARIEYMSKILNGKTTDDLIHEQHRVMNLALNAGRPVYAALTDAQASTFRKKFIDNSYVMTKRWKWIEPCNVPMPESRRQRDGLLQADPDANQLAPRFISAEPFIRWQPVEMTLYEIRHATPDAPASKKN